MDAQRDTYVRQKVASYVAVFVVLAVGYFFLRGSTWQGSTELHTLMEALASLLATAVGILSMARFYAKKNNTFLLIGTGFLGTAMLDSYHAIVTSAFFASNFPSAPSSLIPWSWIAPRLFLSILLWLSWLSWTREVRMGESGRLGEAAVYIAVGSLTVVSFLFFAFVPLPRAYYAEIIFHRPEEFFPALFFLLALVGYVRKGEWKHDAFEHWLVLSLIVGFLSQTIFMSVSGQLFDFEFDAAHLLKKVSYIAVLTGLLINIFSLFKTSESHRAQLAIEVIERQQAQEALRINELEQRELAQENAVVAEVGRIVSSSLAIEEVYEAFAVYLETLIPFDTLNISSIDSETNRLTVLYGFGSIIVGRQPGAQMRREGTLAGETAEKRQSIIVQDEPESLRQRYPMLSPALDAGLRSFLAVPLILNDEAIAVLQLRSKITNIYTETHKSLADRISHQIVGAITNARLHSNLASAAKEREVLAEIGRVISSSIDIGEIYELFAYQVERLLPFDRLAVTTVEPERDRITHPYVSGVRIPGWEPGEFQPYKGSATQMIIEERKGLFLSGDGLHDTGSASPFSSLRAADSSGLRSYIAVPLYASNQPVGTLTLRAMRPDAYTQESLELAHRIGGQIAGAIANARLYARLNTAQEALETSERRYRTLVESGSDVVYTADESGSFSFVAPAVKRLTGYTPEELAGKHFAFLIHKDWVNDIMRFYSRQFKNRELETTYQFPITTKSGEARWVEQRVTLLDLADGMRSFHGVVRDITDRRAAEESELQRSAAEARAEALRRTSQRVVTAQETLRRDIAQQLHGSIQNRLILLLHRLEMARSKVSDEDANTDMQGILQDLHTILENDMRNISRRLYPSILRQGIVPAIQALTDQIESVIPIRVHIDEELVRQERTDRRLTPEPVRLAIFRIAEEALTNIAKHAKASAVEVELRLVKDQNSLRVTVRDDGQGFDLTSTKGSVGLAGMEDYANTMNGKYSIWSAPGKGTLVEATLPISAHEESTEQTIATSE